MVFLLIEITDIPLSASLYCMVCHGFAFPDGDTRLVYTVLGGLYFHLSGCCFFFNNYTFVWGSLTLLQRMDAIISMKETNLQGRLIMYKKVRFHLPGKNLYEFHDKRPHISDAEFPSK